MHLATCFQTIRSLIGLFYAYYTLIAHEAIFCIPHLISATHNGDINSINSTEINNMFTCVALNSISLLAVENKLPCAFFFAIQFMLAKEQKKEQRIIQHKHGRTHDANVQCIVAFERYQHNCFNGANTFVLG